MRKKLEKLLSRMIGWFNPVVPVDVFIGLKRARDVEDTMEKVCKLLKCQPDEINAKIDKVLKHIAELEEEKKKFNSPLDK